MPQNIVKPSILTALIAGAAALSASAQTLPGNTTIDGKTNAISSAVPFLTIGPDARSGGMGDMGIAISPDANAQFWNVAKLAKSDKDMGFSVTYTPWLKDLVPDVFLAYLSGYKKFGADSNQALSASLRYFSLGDVQYTNDIGEPIGTGKPRELAFDVGYSRELSQYLSVGVNLRYIYSNIAGGSVDPSNAYKPGNAFAADAAVYYTKTKDLGNDKAGTISLGAVLANVGSRISYTSVDKDFIPTNLGLGGAYTYQIDAYNKFTIGLDLRKALIPAPITKYQINGSGDTTVFYDRQQDLTVVSGIFKSFAQAPPGYGTHMSLGAEYWYQDQFAARAGYFYENKNDGNRQYFTVGLGVKYNVFGLNFSYLVPTGSGIARNPLSNTLRFSLLFDFDKGEKIAKKSKTIRRPGGKLQDDRPIQLQNVN